MNIGIPRRSAQVVYLALLITLIGTIRCGVDDTRHITNAIEEKLNAKKGYVPLETGKVMLDPPTRDYYRKAETAGLVVIHDIPQDYWGSFLTRTQAGGQPFEITPTPKLLAVARPDTSASKPPSLFYLVKVADSRVSKILKQEQYSGPVARPGEKHLLVLGTYISTPSSAAHVLGQELVGSFDPEQYRFRAIVKYSAFTKQWSIVALDVGALRPEELWFDHNVK